MSKLIKLLEMCPREGGDWPRLRSDIGSVFGLDSPRTSYLRSWTKLRYNSEDWRRVTEGEELNEPVLTLLRDQFSQNTLTSFLGSRESLQVYLGLSAFTKMMAVAGDSLNACDFTASKEEMICRLRDYSLTGREVLAFLDCPAEVSGDVGLRIIFDGFRLLVVDPQSLEKYGKSQEALALEVFGVLRKVVDAMRVH